MTGMTLQVAPELVKPVIEEKIHAAIVAEPVKADQAQLAASVVSRVLHES
jgi:hypothetical protein